MAEKGVQSLVLHVEDSRDWLRIVEETLKGKYRLKQFNNLPDAKKAAEGTVFDYFICDTQILGEDGSAWAEQLHQQGKKVMTLATSGRPGVPMLGKLNFSKAALLKILESL